MRTFYERKESFNFVKFPAFYAFIDTSNHHLNLYFGKESAMFRSDNNSTHLAAFGANSSRTNFVQNPSMAIHNRQDGTGQLRYLWSFRCEVELPVGAGVSAMSPACEKAADDLGALLDRALAFAG